MPNIIAYFMVIAYPIFALAFYQFWTPATAVAATLVVGYLALPSQPVFDFPLLPELNKHTIPAISAMLFATVAVMSAGRNERQAAMRGIKVEPVSMLPGWLPRSGFLLIALAIVILGVAGTLVTNFDSVRVSLNAVLPGLRVYDGFSMLLSLITVLLPFLLGRKFLFEEKHHVGLLKVFAWGGLVYSLFAVIEIRLSPQMNVWIYGYFPHSFGQHVRGGSFRPLVFLQHGLWLAIFQAMALTACLTLSRCAEPEHRKKWLCGGIWIFLVLLMSNSLGGLMLAAMMLVALLGLPARALGFFCLTLVTLSIAYPVLRILDLFPIEAVADIARSINADRGDSLWFRFRNEEELLAKTMEKPVFGWGGWGRGFIYDLELGKRTSTVDSQWIIAVNTGGLVGAFAEYGLYIAGLLGIALGMSRREVPMATRGLMAMLTINMIDMLVNATSTTQTWLIAGTLAGYLEASRRSAKSGAAQQAATVRPPPAAEAPVAEPKGGQVFARKNQVQQRRAPVKEDGTLHEESERYTRQRKKHVRPGLAQS